MDGKSDSECMCWIYLAAFSNVLQKKFSVEVATEAASRDGDQYCFERCRCSIQVDDKFQNFETCRIQNAKLIN